MSKLYFVVQDREIKRTCNTITKAREKQKKLMWARIYEAKFVR